MQTNCSYIHNTRATYLPPYGRLTRARMWNHKPWFSNKAGGFLLFFLCSIGLSSCLKCHADVLLYLSSAVWWPSHPVPSSLSSDPTDPPHLTAHPAPCRCIQLILNPYRTLPPPGSPRRCCDHSERNNDNTIINKMSLDCIQRRRGSRRVIGLCADGAVNYDGHSVDLLGNVADVLWQHSQFCVEAKADYN